MFVSEPTALGGRRPSCDGRRHRHVVDGTRHPIAAQNVGAVPPGNKPTSPLPAVIRLAFVLTPAMLRVENPESSPSESVFSVSF